MSQKDSEKYLIQFFVVVIVIILYLWYRTDSNRIKYIKELEEQIEKYELQISDLNDEIDSYKEELSVLEAKE